MNEARVFAIVLGAALLALSWGVRRGVAERVDHRARELMPRPEGALRGAATGALQLVGYPVAYVPVAALAAWRIGARGHAHGRAIVVAALVGWIAHRALKHVVPHVRPSPGRHVAYDIAHGFPSGHTTGVTAVAVALARVLALDGVAPPAVTIALGVGLPLLMAASRVSRDEHWASDVLGGWVLGTAAALAVVG